MSDMGWNTVLSEQRLNALRDSRQLYVSALKHLLGEDALEAREAPDGTPNRFSERL